MSISWESKIKEKKKSSSGAAGVAQGVECRPSEHELLSSNPYTLKNKIGGGQKWNLRARCWWLMPVILVTCEAEMWRTAVQGWWGEGREVLWDLYLTQRLGMMVCTCHPTWEAEIGRITVLVQSRQKSCKTSLQQKKAGYTGLHLSTKWQ
jgi:hypothetical protein